MNFSIEAHSVPFWKLAIRDPLTLGALLLLVIAGSIQVVAIGAVFWSRVHFGSEFQPSVYSDYCRERSDRSIEAALQLKPAPEIAPVVSQEQAVLVVSQAGRELNEARSREREVQIVASESEKQANQLMAVADEAWKRGDREGAIHQLQLVTQAVPSYLPASKVLAMRHEEHGQFEQAQFQWEKILGMASPESDDSKEAQAHIQQLALKPKKAVDGGMAVVAATQASPPKTISLVGAVRTELPLEDRFDLRFNLQLTLDSKGSEPTMDVSRAAVEITFYDQSFAAGTLVPMKVLSTMLQPKHPWSTGTRQVLSLNYSVPRGYFKRRIKMFGDKYGFCGYVVRVFYRQEWQSSYAEPREPLESFAHRTTIAIENKP